MDGHKYMKRIDDIQELRSIQIGIMDSIHAFCTKHDIKYSLGGGTLIGAFRHHGYIPWDDDIDIYLMRRDYERFLREYHDTSGRYRLLCPATTDHYFYTFSKVIDTHTIMYEDETDGFEIGVYVDVFPIDYVPDDMKARRRVFWWKHLLYKIRRCKMSKTVCLHSALAFYCYRYLPVTVGFIDLLLKHYVHRRRPSGFICEMCETGRPLKGCYSAQAFEDTFDVAFENRTYKAMKGYDEYLTNTYGNYMALPPEDQRTQHQFKAYYK